MKRVFIRSIMGAALATVFAVGCTTAAPKSGESAASGEKIGTTDVALSIQSTQDLKLFPAVDYTVKCPGFVKSGSFRSSLPYEITGAVSGVPAGPGCTVALSAKSSDGAWTCSGTSRTFKEVCAAPRQSDEIRLQLACVSTRVKSWVHVPIIGAVSVGCHDPAGDLPGCGPSDDAGIDAVATDAVAADADVDAGDASTCAPTTCAASNVACGALADTCGGTINCGTCPGSQACTSDGHCVDTCTTTTCAASNATCGSIADGCGGTLDCGSCADGNTCTSTGQCVPSCVPTTCAAASLSCGKLSDGCGGTLDCGTCGDGQSCTSGQCTTTCTPKTCSAANVGCGSISDGCGGTIDCGSCDAGQSCSAAGQCIVDCTPSTCNSLNVGCGPLSDGCGGTLDCGSCGQGNTCTAAGQCVSTCIPTTCAASSVTCGTLSDGCGGTLTCGACGAGQTCTSAGQCVSTCTPKTCAAAGLTCGTLDDGCGGTLSCGTCAVGQTCTAAGQCVAPQKSACADNNNGGDCTPTEQRFVDKSAACYACMVNGGCLDDALFGDTGHECGDLSGNATRGAKAGTAKSDLCLSTIDCILQPQTVCASSDVNICYCGSLGAGNGCATATSGANGACFQQEVDGLEHSATDAPSAVLPDYTDLTRGAGLANQLFVCAKSNGCDTLCAQ